LFVIVEYLYVLEKHQVLYYFLLPALSGILLIALISYRLSKITILSTFFISLGKFSLEIYILHILFTAGIRILLVKFFNIENILIHIILGTLLGVLIPYVITWRFQNKKNYKRLFKVLQSPLNEQDYRESIVFY
jgi:fucose 4-O-acetylase-like acetyltransferase